MWFLTDRILPRFLTKIPYDLAAFIINLRIRRISNSKVWYRNSYVTGNYVFGVSDLDISIMMDRLNPDQIIKITSELKKLKRVFPFVGEINFFIRDHVVDLSPSLNLYEKKRDPIINSLMMDYAPFGQDVEKAVFLLRMLEADKKNLLEIPLARQKKWRNHFQELNLSFPRFIDKNFIIKTIMALIAPESNDKEINEAINFLFCPLSEDEHVLFENKPAFWKFLYPNRHFWSDDLSSENLNMVKNSSLRWICLRQIDWEIWGLNTQLALNMHSDDNIKDHIKKLHKVALALAYDYCMAPRIDKLFHNLLQFKDFSKAKVAGN